MKNGDLVENPIIEPSFLYGGNPFKELRNKFLMAKESNAVEIEGNLPEGIGIENPTIFTSLKVDIAKGAKTYNESLISYYEFISGEGQKYNTQKQNNINWQNQKNSCNSILLAPL